MKYLRVGPAGAERPAAHVDGRHLDLSAVTPDIDGAFLAAGGLSPDDVATLPELDITGLRIGPPIARPGAVVCVGLNYAAHAAESGVQPPAQPVIFLKTPNTVGGPDDDVRIPLRSSKTDWEVELGVVIGTPASYLESPDESLGCVAGFVLTNDL